MHATRVPLLLAAFTLTATLPVAVLVGGDSEPAATRAEPLCAAPPRVARPAFAAVGLSDADLARAVSLADPAPVDDRDAEIDRLRVALVAAAEEIDRLTHELHDRDSLWQVRLDRDRLEDDLHAILQQEFPDIVALRDPNADDDVEGEVVSILMEVAAWLAPETIEVDGMELPGARVTLADVRTAVNDAALHRLAQRLPWWNLQLALTPYPGTWCTSDEHGVQSGCTLRIAREIGGEVVTVQEIQVEHGDPRVDIAREACDGVSQRRARDLEALLGLPAGVLE